MQVPYNSSVLKPAKSVSGKIMYWVSRHPLRTASVFSVITVILAAGLLTNVLISSPETFAMIGGAIFVGWVIFFFVLRPVLEEYGVREVNVPRYIEIEPGRFFRWMQGNKELGRIENPHFVLYTKPVPEKLVESSGADRSWPIWLVVTGEKFVRKKGVDFDNGDTFVIKTEVTAMEASHYKEVPKKAVRNTDEVFSTGLASSILDFADRARGV